MAAVHVVCIQATTVCSEILLVDRDRITLDTIAISGLKVL